MTLNIVLILAVVVMALSTVHILKRKMDKEKQTVTIMPSPKTPKENKMAKLVRNHYLELSDEQIIMCSLERLLYHMSNGNSPDPKLLGLREALLLRSRQK